MHQNSVKVATATPMKKVAHPRLSHTWRAARARSDRQLGTVTTDADPAPSSADGATTSVDGDVTVALLSTMTG
jgi:hypothetical protein